MKKAREFRDWRELKEADFDRMGIDRGVSFWERSKRYHEMKLEQQLRANQKRRMYGQRYGMFSKEVLDAMGFQEVPKFFTQQERAIALGTKFHEAYKEVYELMRKHDIKDPEQYISGNVNFIAIDDISHLANQILERTTKMAQQQTEVNTVNNKILKLWNLLITSYKNFDSWEAGFIYSMRQKQLAMCVTHADLNGRQLASLDRIYSDHVNQDIRKMSFDTEQVKTKNPVKENLTEANIRRIAKEGAAEFMHQQATLQPARIRSIAVEAAKDYVKIAGEDGLFPSNEHIANVVNIAVKAHLGQRPTEDQVMEVARRTVRGELINQEMLPRELIAAYVREVTTEIVKEVIKKEFITMNDVRKAAKKVAEEEVDRLRKILYNAL